MKKTYSKSGLIIAIVLVFGFGLGCGQNSKPKTIFMPDMVYSQAIKAQEEGSMKPPVKGTIPRGFEPYAYTENPDAAGKELKNPLKPTNEVLVRGKKMYDTYCLVCHGPQGEGDGTIVPKFPRPPSLQSDKVKNWTDGRIYHVIVAGQNLMPSYASQVATADRWSIIHYLRVLHRSKNPTADDLKVFQEELGN